MKSNHKSPIWPYLAVLACLFAVCVLAPRGWQRLARIESIDRFVADNTPRLSERERRWQLAAGGHAAPVEQPAPSTAVAVVDAPAGGAASNAPAQLTSVAGAGPSTAGVAASDEVQRLAAANAPAQRSGAEPSETPATKNPWSLFRTAATRTSGSPTRTVSQTAPAPTAPPSPAAIATDERRVPPPASVPPVKRRPTAAVAPVATETAGPRSAARDLGEKIAEHGNEPVRYPAPEALLAELNFLASVPATRHWAADARSLLNEVSGDSAGAGRAASAVFADLRRHAERGEQIATSLPDPQLASQLLRAQYALARRVDVWEHVSGMSSRKPVDSDALVLQRMPGALDAVESLTRAQQGGTAWREYLLLPRLRRLVGREANASPDERRKIARHVLTRLSNVKLSSEQRKFVDDRAMADFRAELQHLAAEPVNQQEMLIDLERYERTGSALDAHRLAANCRWLCWSGDSEDQQLGARLEEHYRNANIRLAVSQSFLTRFLPQPAATVAPVRDTIAGADVEGQSTTYTQLGLVLIPDAQRLRLGVEAHGTVQSNTAATSGPATFHTSGQSQFVARKLVLFGPRGMTLFPAMSEAESTRQQLVSLETSFDRVPLLNSVVRNIARNEHDASQGTATSEVEQKVANRARLQFDNEFDPKVRTAVQKFNDRVRSPLDRLGLEPQLLAASTSEDRAVLRLRLAGQDQLAAFTPRPRAPSDSLVSLQIHQSGAQQRLGEARTRRPDVHPTGTIRTSGPQAGAPAAYAAGRLAEECDRDVRRTRRRAGQLR